MNSYMQQLVAVAAPKKLLTLNEKGSAKTG